MSLVRFVLQPGQAALATTLAAGVSGVLLGDELRVRL